RDPFPGARQVGPGGVLEGGRQHVVHRLEVVVDQPARRAHRGRHVAHGGGAEALTTGDRQGRVDDGLAAIVGGQAGHPATLRPLLRNCPTKRYGRGMLRQSPFHARVAAANQTSLWSHWAGHLVVDKYQMAEKWEYT